MSWDVQKIQMKTLKASLFFHKKQLIGGGSFSPSVENGLGLCGNPEKISINFFSPFSSSSLLTTILRGGTGKAFLPKWTMC